MVTQYTNILSEELYIEIVEYISKLMKDRSNAFTTSTLEWETGLKGNSTPILRYVFQKEDSLIFYKIKKEIEKIIPYFITDGVLHIFPNLSYIRWHDDHLTKAALTIYLNEKWDVDWGGYLLYEIHNEIKAIKPGKNLGVLQENSVKHSVSTINIGADNRVSLQFFLSNNKKII